MAYWIIPFTNFDGTNYEIWITKPSSSQTDSYLTGAPHTIVVQEDDDDYMFKPVRTQSGYIRIVDTGYEADGQTPFDWHDLIPTSSVSHPVELMNIDDGERVWCGFLKPEIFQTSINIIPQEREFPICGVLNVLEGFDMKFNSDNMENLGYLLYQIFHTNLPSGFPSFFSDFYFQGVDYVEPESTGWLFQRISPALFNELSKSGIIRGYKYNCLQMLEYFCQFFGLTCRMNNSSVYFVSPSAGFASLGFTKLITYDLFLISINQSTYSPTYVNFVTEAFQSAFVDVENYENIRPGLHSVKVVEDVDKIDTLLTLPLDEIAKYLLKNSGYFYGSTPSLAYRYGVQDADEGKGGYWLVEQAGPFNTQEWTKIFGNTSVTVYKYDRPYVTQLPPVFAEFRLQDWDDNSYDSNAESATLIKKTYNFSPLVEVMNNRIYQQNGSAITIKTLNPVGISNGVLVLTIDTQIDSREPYTGAHKTYNGHGTLTVSLCIGDKYWDQTNMVWTTTKTLFNITIGGDAVEQGPGKILTNRILSGMIGNAGPYPPYEGYGIPVTSGLGGIVKFDIYSVALTDPATQMSMPGAYVEDSYVFITNFNIQFLRGNSVIDWNDNTQNEYKNTNNTSFIDDRTINNIITTDNNNAPGNGILFTPNGAYCDVLVFSEDGGSEEEVPGVYLAATVARFYNKTRTIMQVNQRDHVYTDPLPQTKITYNGKTWFPLCWSRDWWDDKLTTKLIEL